jgi:hypothetical protein
VAHPRPVIVLELAGTQSLLVDAAQGGDQSECQLGSGHLHREHRHRLLGLERGVLGHVERQRGLAHRRARREDDEVGRLQTRGLLVEIGETGGQAGDGTLAGVSLLQDAERIPDRAAHRDEALASTGAGLGDPEHALLGRFQHFAAATPFGLEAIIGDVRANIDQLPQNRLLAHDVGVGGDVGRARRGAGQLQNIAAASDLLGMALRFEPLTQRHRVAGLAGLRQFADRAEDELVVAAIEVLFGQAICHLIPGPLGQHQAAQHGLFGFDRVRRNARRIEAGFRTFGLAPREDDGHGIRVGGIGGDELRHVTQTCAIRLQTSLWITRGNLSRCDFRAVPETKRAPEGARLRRS